MVDGGGRTSSCQPLLQASRYALDERSGLLLGRGATIWNEVLRYADNPVDLSSLEWSSAAVSLAEA